MSDLARRTAEAREDVTYELLRAGTMAQRKELLSRIVALERAEAVWQHFQPWRTEGIDALIAAIDAILGPEIEAAVERIGPKVMTLVEITQQHDKPLDHRAVECSMCDSYVLHLRASIYDEIKAAEERGRQQGRRDALEGLHCTNNWEDGRDCTFADVSLEEACERCTAIATPTRSYAAETKPTEEHDGTV